MIDCRDSETDRVNFAKQVVIVGEWRGLVKAGDLLRPRLLNVDHARKSTQFGIQPRMLLPEMSDTNNCYLHDYSTATIAMPASFASRINSSRSIMSVFRASIAKAETFRRTINRTVAGPI